MKKWLILIIAFSLLALWPFFKKGYFESHDGEWMVIRFSAFHQTLAAGQFPVRFVDRLNNNYGYPVLNFLYPLPFYLSELPKLLGFGFVDSVKIIFVLTTLGSTIAMYWALRQSFSEFPSIAGALIYIFIPYRFVDLYVRGSLGENVAFLFVPLVFGSVLKILQGKTLFLPVLAFLTFLLILSHNVIAAVFIPFLFMLSIIISRKEIIKTLIFMVLGILMATFFWFPAVYDLRFVKFPQLKISNIADHVVDFSRLTVPSWGYGPLPEGMGSFSPQIGLVSIGVVLTATYLILFKKSKTYVASYMLVFFAASLFLMTDYSLLFWEYVPFVDIIQFPWRLLSLIVFITAFLTAYVISYVKKPSAPTIIIVLAAIISTAGYVRPISFVDRGDGFYSTNEDSTTVRNEYMPIWVNDKLIDRADKKIIVDENSRIIAQDIKPAAYKALIQAEGDTQVTVNTVYFPGWQVKVDGKKSPIDYRNKNGLITFRLSQGQHQVIIDYAKTPVHLASEMISLTALVGTGSYFAFIWRKQNSW